MTPTEYKELLAEAKESLRSELDHNDFIFDFGYTEQSFPEQEREFVLENGMTATVKFIAEGHRHIDRGDYYTPPSESAEIIVGITHIEIWDTEGESVAEYKAGYPYHDTNSFTIKF